MSSKKSKIILLGIFVVSLLLRLVVVFYSPVVLSGDEGAYVEWATFLLKGQGFGSGADKLTSWKPPGYSFFLALVFFFFGQNYLAVKIIQAVIGSSLCILVFLLGRKIFSESVGLVAAIMLALNLAFIYTPETILSENIFVFLFLLVMLSFVQMWKQPSFRNQIAVGFILGLATLTRAETILFPVFILFALLLKERLEKRRFIEAGKSFMVILFFFLLCLVPWTMRNYYVHHSFVPVATEGGVTLYASYCPPQGKLFGSTPKGITAPQVHEGEIQMSRYYTKEAIKFIKENPSKLPKLTLLKILFFFSPFEWELTGGKGIYNAMFVFSLPFFILGIYFLRRRMLEFLPLYLPVVYYFLLAIVFQGTPRWRSCVEPYMIVIAAIGIWLFSKKFVKKLIPYMIMAAFLFVNFVMYIYSDSVKDGFRSVLQWVGLW